MFKITHLTQELIDNADFRCRLAKNQIGKAAAFVKDGKLHGFAAFLALDGTILISAYLTEELKKQPMVFHRVAVRTLKQLHKTYDKIYAPGVAMSRGWMLRLGFKPCTDKKDMFGEKEGFIKCRK